MKKGAAGRRLNHKILRQRRVFWSNYDHLRFILHSISTRGCHDICTGFDFSRERFVKKKIERIQKQNGPDRRKILAAV